MKRNPDVGASCGRIHPTGSGYMQWYQVGETFNPRGQFYHYFTSSTSIFTVAPENRPFFNCKYAKSQIKRPHITRATCILCCVVLCCVDETDCAKLYAPGAFAFCING